MQSDAPPPAPCALEEALSGAGIGVLDLGQAMGTEWSSLMAPIGGTSFDTPDGGRGGGILGPIDDAFRVNEGRSGESDLLSETTEVTLTFLRLFMDLFVFVLGLCTFLLPG